MAIFTIQAPDGRKIKIEAADEATAVRGAQEWSAANPMESPQPSGAYTESLGRASEASQFFNREAPPQRPDMMGSIATTLAGGVNGIPVLGPAVQNISDALVGTGAQLTGGNYGETVRGLQDRRAELAAANPIANIAGNIGGATTAFGVGGMTNTGAQALGLSGSLGQQVVNSGLSTLGLTAADNMVRGQAPVEALGNAVAPGAISAALPVVGAGVRAGAEGAARTITNRAQNKLTTAAIQNAPDAATLRSAASSMFDSATGGTPLAISDNAYFRFLGDVKQFADKLRINPDNDPQATGLLSTLMRIADDTSNGVAVDLKDLHLVRQLARKVSGSAQGRDSAMGQQVVTKLDDFIKSLKPADILGGADPSAAASNLMSGISTWSRASKVGLIEEAIEKAGTYKSGLENGLRLQFQAILRKPETRRLFTAAERMEIEKVANGTAGSNAMTLLGKFGFGTDGATNMLGGTIGSSIGATLGSALGPVGSLAGAGLSAGIGSGARKVSERMGLNAANRASQVVATPNIPQAIQRNVPPAVLRAIEAAKLGARGAAMGTGLYSAANAQEQPLEVVVSAGNGYSGLR